ncbi:MAG: hypothetical protein ACXVBB_07960, partial [Isosphaeraceae bacterium]
VESAMAHGPPPSATALPARRGHGWCVLASGGSGRMPQGHCGIRLASSHRTVRPGDAPDASTLLGADDVGRDGVGDADQHEAVHGVPVQRARALQGRVADDDRSLSVSARVAILK